MFTHYEHRELAENRVSALNPFWILGSGHQKRLIGRDNVMWPNVEADFGQFDVMRNFGFVASAITKITI